MKNRASFCSHTFSLLILFFPIFSFSTSTHKHITHTQKYQCIWMNYTLCARPFTQFHTQYINRIWIVEEREKAIHGFLAFTLWWCIVYAWKHYTRVKGKKISIEFLHTQTSVQTKNRKVKLWHTVTSSESEPII